MAAIAPALTGDFRHGVLESGVEYAVDLLPQRHTVALCFRILAGLAEEPDELLGVGGIVESTLTKGTARYDGQGLADAFDRLGAHWGTASGRQSMLARVLCLPEFVPQVIELVAEFLRCPTFPAEACEVAVELAQQELKHLEDEPQDLLRIMIQRLTLGPVLGRFPGGTPESLAAITPAVVRAHWERLYRAGRLQVTAAGPLDADELAAQIERHFEGWGRSQLGGREPVSVQFTPARQHRHKELEQQYIGVTLPGARKGAPDFPVEQVLLGVLSGGMSGRLFTEVREKRGLVYWVGAWSEQLRGVGYIHLGASTTPERCEQTHATLLSELRRVGSDLTEAEVVRARDGLIAQYETEDDLTRARAASLSDDLLHFGRPIGRAARLTELAAVELDEVRGYARRLPLEQLCVATLGPRAM